ncbi:shikimate kinase [Clostridium cochlearium]|uniref:Shikimate kinase n=2 Tax=Clostridium cochlearium TaxID=1494 RepID=A0ABY0QKN0_CLOCO|nr:shikimate kinase [Clostridium cochlearium]MDU1443766.1 shikimate kinase [Clostridium cochlearium]NMA57236.1 shikimate kinase [Clostridium cochlearium]SDL07696.1 shikimate kinase [Clostridium cochlearium]SNV79869.1 shikimate kinase [Clostridium cochlearium]STA92800.1 shikimate kinase [Clostridium cochlearium]
MVNILIFLIGMPAAGKSTIGKELSKIVKYDFIDTDCEIERKEKKSIKNIFKEKGEGYFRKLEKDLLKDIIKSDKKVVATGGGLPIYSSNMDILNKEGITIFLDVPFEELLRRNKKNNKRPLLDKENKYDRLKEIYNSRIHIYNKCKIKVENYNISVYELCIKILKEVNNF